MFHFARSACPRSLIDDHAKYLGTQGRIGAREAKNIFDLRVATAWPALAQTPEIEITQET